MVVDNLENMEKYASLNPLFPKAIEFLSSTNLYALDEGRIELAGNDLVVNITKTTSKSKEEAILETHNKFIDIQIPLSGTEIMGYMPAKDCLPTDAPYDESNDITFFESAITNYITITPGMFAIFFPQDGHAPAISPNGVKKIIVKVKS